MRLFDPDRIEYHRSYRDKNRSVLREKGLSRYHTYKNARLNNLYHQFKRRNERLTGKRSVDFTFKEFLDWYDLQTKECYYCKCPENIVASIKWGRYNVKNLTIDRKDNNIGYSILNICLSCDVCNSSKRTAFTEEDFIEIGMKYIRPKWEKLASHLK